MPTKKRFSAIIIFLFLTCLFVQPAAAQNGFSMNRVDKTEAERWREDLRYMADQMPRLHNNLFHTITREQFETAVKKLDERIPTLARHQIIVEMARLTALVNDGHTNVYPTRDAKIGFRQFPLKMYFFKDGLFVRAATAEHAALVGAKVVKIGKVSVEQAYAAVREIIGQDNEMDAKFFAPHLLAMPEVLHALGLSESPESAKFTFEIEGRQAVVEVKGAGLAEMMAADTDKTWLPKDGWLDARGKDAKVLWLKDPNNKFWYEYLPDSKTVYVQFNEVHDKDNETIEAFSKRLFDFVDANPVERMVLDLRLNRGGNGGLNKPLLLGIIKSAKINQRGKLFAVIGRSTFSATQFLVNNLEKYTNTIFVGEPSGSKGNIYGDSRKIFLPNSGITVRVSVYFWQDWDPWDTREWTAPDLTAELSSEDYRQNNDPALKAIFAYVPQKSLTEILDEALTKGGIDLTVKIFNEFTKNPVNKYASTEQSLLEAGQRLLNEKKYDEAAVLFQINAAQNPNSFRAYFALGEAYARIGKKELAIENFEKSLRINPKNYDVIQRYKELKENRQ
jgi:tetratricopeptide (TPR) repeat protein